MADIPSDLLETIAEFEKLLIVDQQKLKEITDRFVFELQ